jgi:hypothetical protein
METNKEKNDIAKIDPDKIDNNVTGEETATTEDNIEKNSSSKITSNFEKKHGRVNNSLGDSHEPGTTPGTGV